MRRMDRCRRFRLGGEVLGRSSSSSSCPVSQAARCWRRLLTTARIRGDLHGGGEGGGEEQDFDRVLERRTGPFLPGARAGGSGTMRSE